MIVRLHLLSQSNPITYTSAINCFTKDGLFCVYFRDDKAKEWTHKYPLCNIYRVVEDWEDYNKADGGRGN